MHPKSTWFEPKLRVAMVLSHDRNRTTGVKWDSWLMITAGIETSDETSPPGVWTFLRTYSSVIPQVRRVCTIVAEGTPSGTIAPKPTAPARANQPPSSSQPLISFIHLLVRTCKYDCGIGPARIKRCWRALLPGENAIADPVPGCYPRATWEEGGPLFRAKVSKLQRVDETSDETSPPPVVWLTCKIARNGVR
jgi:hypothetical protein